MISTLSRAALALLVLSAPAAAAEELDTIKELYAAASYEEALVKLDALSSNVDLVVANQYRALCLLGLGRSGDAESALQEIVTANPLYRVSAADVSPRLVDLFKEVRRRALPSAARQLYTKAKAEYDAKNHAEALARFRTLLDLLADPEFQPGAETGDLKALAEGFVTLADAQIPKTPAPAPANAATAAASTAAAPPPSVPAAPRIYSAEDRDVRAPVEMERVMPRWTPTSALDQRRTFRGVLRLIVDEQGRVEAADLVTPVFPAYNDELLRAARTWRYRPATRNGAPVKYSLTLAIVLRPQGNQD